MTLRLCENVPVTTMADLLAQRQLALVPVHLPRPELAIRWVATSELVDPSPFLEGGEVLLSTGLETRGWTTEWADYVARLAGVGVVAVGLAAGLTHPHSPRSLVAACRRHDMNLFEVPKATTFVAVSRQAARLLEAADRAETEEALAAHRQLTEQALRGNRAGVLGQLGERSGGAAALAGPDGGLVLEPLGPAAHLLDPGLVAQEVRRMRPRGLRAASSTGMPGGTLLVHPVGVSGQPDGYLAAAFPGRVTAVQRGLVSTAVALLSFDAERSRSRREVDRRLRARAVELLVAGDRGTAALLLSARPEQPPVRVPGRGVVLRATGSRLELDDALARVEDQLPLSGRMSGELVVVVPLRQRDAVAETLAGHGLRVGIGEAAPPERLGASHETAGQALAATTAAAPVAAWEEHVRRGALSLMEPGRAAAFARSFLAPLDGPHRAELVETLQAFLRHHGSMLAVAEDLGVHRNTVRNRLGQVERLVGISLDDPQARVNAWIALQASSRPDVDRPTRTPRA